MKNLNVRALRVFVPAKDHDVSTRFYEDLGFELVWSGFDVSEMGIAGFSFFLQNYYQKEWADNFMVQLKVADLGAWWELIVEKDLVARYEGVRAKAPTDYPWGLREIHLVDPAGVLWHIAQDQG